MRAKTFAACCVATQWLFADEITCADAPTSSPSSSGAASAQFHLSLVGDGANGDRVDFMLDWVTDASVKNSSIKFSSVDDKSLNETAVGELVGIVEEDKSGRQVACWTTLLPGLPTKATVSYALESHEKDIQQFQVHSGDFTWAVFGDIGAPINGKASGVSFPALETDLKGKAYQGILNIGDLGYELVYESGRSFMESFAKLTSSVPMHTTIGNHEYIAGASPLFAMRNYHRLFNGLRVGAGAASGTYTNEFYSFNSGLVHFVFINTEVYGDEAFMVQQKDENTWANDNSARENTRQSQAEWLQYDLSRVDRSKTPYIVVSGHRPPHAVSDKYKTDILPLLSKYQVDLLLCGHEHLYLVFDETTVDGLRLPPVIVSGSPGNNEYVRPVSQLKLKSFKPSKYIEKYGYGYLTANAEGLHWQWGQTTKEGSGTTPTPLSQWQKEHELTIARQSKLPSSPGTPEGKPIKEPQRPTVKTLATTIEPGESSTSASVPGKDGKESSSNKDTSATSNDTKDTKDPKKSLASRSSQSLGWVVVPVVLSVASSFGW